MYKYDVIVVGGGYFGSSIAYHLAKNNINTILLEQKQIGYGSSGANFGCVQVQDAEPGLSLELTLRSYRKVKKLEEELKTDLEFREMGGIIVAENDKEMALLVKLSQIKNKQGLDIKIFNPEQSKEIEPSLEISNIAGASYCVQGHLNAFKLLYGFIKRAKDYGLTVQEETKVKEIIIHNGKCRGVRIESDNIIYADNIIIATGAWTKKLCKDIGITIPVDYVRSEAFVTERIDPLLKNYFSLASFFSEAHDQKKSATSLCAVQTRSGNLLIGETSKPGDENPDKITKLTTSKHCVEINKGINKYFPSLKNIKIIRSWTTCSPYTKSLLPVFGSIGPKGLIVAAGFKSAVILTPIVGEIVVDLIIKGKTFCDLREFTSQAKVI